ncbi:hypothetical protein [Streptomyces beigongshangae]|uniref:hypothetical protein n=1 Tax=Streptomyces beigongshangae TaxID=2841597 RepID=UPI001C86363E|nr:hypothetical protein [Streptomyces sp. REN17]
MPLLRALIRTVRMARNTSGLAAGLPDDDEVLLDAPDERLGPALVAAGRGDFGAAAALLRATREGAEWENRDRYTARLAAFALSRGEWFDDWRAAAPHDPDATLVGAELALCRGRRSPARAELLRRIAPLVSAAAEGDPRDPVPWRIALDHARGTDAPRTEFERVWAQAVRRSPHHYGCHVAALRYLCAARHGSHDACLDFAERAARDALPGSLVQALPVRAAFAYLMEDGGGAVPRERLHAAADLAVALSREYPDADPWPAEARNLLVYVLIRLDRWEDALDQLRRIGPYATSFPWDRLSDDPLGQFLELRDGIRLQVASERPLRARRRDLPHPRGGHGGRGPRGDH